ncbi:MAG: energy transducer TonB [Prevotellaceae bacterium]|jgi:protein TonB|nr:energy transducer TonB [Prevotellaceae bacterium]
MARNINITGREWTSLIFAERNRAYGAYAIRNTTTRRHVTAYFLILAFAAMIIAIPTLKHMIAPSVAAATGTTDVIQLSTIDLTPPVAHVPQIVNAAPPMPAALRPSVKFTTFNIVNKTTDLTEDPATIAAILNTPTTTIGTQTHGGVPEGAPEPPAPTTTPDDTPMMVAVIDRPPIFPYDMVEWLYKELKYPTTALEVGLEGRVTLQFVIGKDGKVTDVEILKGVDPILDREAERVLAKMPDWIPGRHNGKTVAVRFIIPVIFKMASR